jgi:phenylpropionate dioxygenase-like ring-hydroxylating dioxygenase large terminal subunit
MSKTIDDTRQQIQRGASSAVSPLAGELLARDSHRQSTALSSTGNHDPVVREVPFSRYYDPQFAALEREKLWSKIWQYACREEDIPEVGDRVPYEAPGMSLIIVRSAPDEIRAFHNACLHRGTKLCTGFTSTPTIRCPFHAWEWNLDGSLHNIPSNWDFPHVSREGYRLPEAKVGRWGGFIFVHPEPDNAPPLERVLGVLPEHFKHWKPEDRFTFVRVRKRIRANWKTVMEAFLESYHVVETHSDSLGFTGDASTQYDIWDDGVSHVSRLITPSAVPSPHLGDSASRQEALDMLMRAYSLSMPGAELPRFDASKGAGRAEVAQWRREIMAQQFGKDFSHLSDAEMLDSIQYYMFPNFCPWYGEGLPLVYQFLPLGDDPNVSVMDVRLLLPTPASGRPPSAPIIDLDFDDSMSAAPGFGILCHIFDQDMSNLPQVQAGMRIAAPGFKRGTLGRYQESRIQHFHNTLERYLGLR